MTAANFSVNKDVMNDVSLFATATDYVKTDSCDIVDELKKLQSEKTVYRGDKAESFLETIINSTKVLVDKYNTQMTTQKKISKASEDPVIAIRSLRLSTSLSHLDQYKDNNIPDASSWMDVTETALSNMKSLLTDIRTQCVNGSTDTLTADDRNTILQQLTALSEQVYTEGNADYAGRTVFTGYRTSSKLTFQKDTKSTYQITQEFSAADLSEKRYYTNGVTVPNSINAATPDCTTDVTEHSFQRIRLGYGNTTDDVKLSIDGKELTPGTDYTVYKSVSDFDPSKRVMYWL
jgi:flagellar hook-associated protein 3 FlgL